MRALTEGQMLVLKRTVAGDDAKSCARSLGLSLDTIKDRRYEIIHRLDAKNMPHAVAIAFRKGILT